jgi:hypothetical protein
MDIMRMACEVARHQPSADGMYRLIEVLDLLIQIQNCEASRRATQSPMALIPMAAVKRFSDAVRRAHVDLTESILWWEVTNLLRDPPGMDSTIWRSRILPYLRPQTVACVDKSDASGSQSYPAFVDAQLVSAAERCHRTLTS